MDSNIKTESSSAAKAASVDITTNDNENNELTGIPDNDMDVYLFNNNFSYNSPAPIEFNIFIDNENINEAQLSILAWDVDWSYPYGYGERDRVYINGHFLGYMTGANAEWSTTIFNVDPSWIVPGPNGKNLVQVFIDEYNEGWAITVDWGQLVIDGGTSTSAEYRSVTIPKTIYQACEMVSITEEIDADPNLYVRAETNIVDPDGNIIAGTSRYLTATTGDEPFTENLMIPCTAGNGEYNVVTILYDGATNVQLDIIYTPFSISDCPDDIVIGNDPGQCGAVVEYNTPPGVLTEGLASGAFFPIGTTTVSYAAPECSFSVTVNDVEAPVAICQTADIYLEKNGTVTVMPEDVDGGSSDNCLFELSVSPASFDCDDLGMAVSIDQEVGLTATDASGNTDACISTVSILQRPTTVTYYGELTGQYSDEVNLSATLVDDLSGDGIAGMTIVFEIGSQSATAVTDASGLATTTLTLDQNPCDLDEWTVISTFDGDCPFWNSASEVAFAYEPENAALEYTGTNISATVKSGSDDFVVTLRGAIMDAKDGSAGDVSNAKARFVVDGSPVCDWLDVMLFDANDPSLGVIEYDWEDVISKDVQTFDVQIELLGCYFAGISAAHPLTVYNAAGDFITGGGHMIMTETASGLYSPTPGSKLNFGFNIKFNKKGTNLQGKMNIIYREYDALGELMYKYQIKSNATTSLGTNLADADALIAEFVSKAELIILDEYDNVLSEIGNLTLHVIMTDKGEPGNEDAIGFSLYNGDPSDPNALWFSSNWDMIKTIEKVIDGGNLLIHSGAALESLKKPGVIFNEADLQSGIDEMDYNIYPNPFNEQVYFEFNSPSEVMAIIDIYDMTGRKIKTVFEQEVKADFTYKAEFTPENLVSGMYYYRMQLGQTVINGRLIYNQ